jgi:hypothetical protein
MVVGQKRVRHALVKRGATFLPASEPERMFHTCSVAREWM